MKICTKYACTGCLACIDVCAGSAITLSKDKQGFNIPVVNERKCAKCGRCVGVCPANTQKKYEAAATPLACWNKNKAERYAATSGGVFTMLAKSAVRQGGVIYGAAFNEDMRVAHIRIDKMDGIYSLRGSKYVQSNTLYLYSQVGEDLKAGRKVLFSGTPCQVAALKNFLGRDYENLISVDIMCHGVPSPMVFDDYKAWLERKHGSRINKLNFRYKRPSWTVFSIKVDFENGQKYVSSKYEDPYHCFFSLGGVI